jgi:hypothetical protein
LTAVNNRTPEIRGIATALAADIMELTNIDLGLLDNVTGGGARDLLNKVDFGKVHTVIQQGANCAGVAFFPGFLAKGPKGGAWAALGAGAVCAGTATAALIQGDQQQAQPSAATPAK